MVGTPVLESHFQLLHLVLSVLCLLLILSNNKRISSKQETIGVHVSITPVQRHCKIGMHCGTGSTSPMAGLILIIMTYYRSRHPLISI